MISRSEMKPVSIDTREEDEPEKKRRRVDARSQFKYQFTVLENIQPDMVCDRISYAINKGYDRVNGLFSYPWKIIPTLFDCLSEDVSFQRACGNYLDYFFRKMLVEFLAMYPDVTRLDLAGVKRFFCDGEVQEQTLRDFLPANHRITSLDLSNCGIEEDSGLEWLVSVPHLNLSGNLIRYDGAKKLATNLYGFCNNIRQLSMMSCDIDSAAVVEIASIPNLEELNLSCNHICDAGAIAISKMKNIKRVSLEQCNISAKGVKALLSNPGISVLRVDGSFIDEACILAIVRVAKSRVSELAIVLSEYDISANLETSHAAIIEVMKTSTLFSIHGLDNQSIDLMNDRNALLKKFQKFSEYRNYIKCISHEHGLYEFQENEQDECQQPFNFRDWGLFGRLRNEELGSHSQIRLDFAMDIAGFIKKLKAYSEQIYNLNLLWGRV